MVMIQVLVKSDGDDSSPHKNVTVMIQLLLKSDGDDSTPAKK